MAPKKVLIYRDGLYVQVDESETLEAKMREVLKPTTFGQLKERNATIRVNCRAFACWKVSDIPARDIAAPDEITDIKSLHFFGLKCPHCKCAFMMLSVV